MSAFLRAGNRVSEVASLLDQEAHGRRRGLEQTCWQSSKECCGSRQLERCNSKPQYLDEFNVEVIRIHGSFQMIIANLRGLLDNFKS